MAFPDELAISRQLLKRYSRTGLPARSRLPRERLRSTPIRPLSQDAHRRPNLAYQPRAPPRPAGSVLSSAVRQFDRNDFRQQIRRSLYLSTLFLVSYFSAKYLYNHVPAENRYPSCAEWSLQERELWQEMHAMADNEGLGLKRWPGVVKKAEALLDLLDDTEGVIPAEDGVGTGLEFWMQLDGDRRLPRDLRAMSYAWRVGYYETLLMAIQACEKLSGKLLLRGPPSNSKDGEAVPTPKIPPYAAPAAPDPEHYYNSLLTTPGFTNLQYFSTAHQFATFLEYSFRSHEAEVIYQSLLDSSVIALPPKVSHIIDPCTAVIQHNAPPAIVSANLLESVTWLARFWARQGDTQKALPALLSVLRARQNLPVEPTPMLVTAATRDAQMKDRLSATSKMRAWIEKSFYEPPPVEEPPNSSGLEPPPRDPHALCEEAALMADIGEILFTSSHRADKERALRWTIKSVDLGAGIYGGLDAQRDRPAMEFCRGCVEGALQNWGAMLDEFQANVARAMAQGLIEDKVVNGASKRRSWRDIFWNWEREPEVGSENALLRERARWEKERERFEGRRGEVGTPMARDLLKWYQEDGKREATVWEWFIR